IESVNSLALVYSISLSREHFAYVNRFRACSTILSTLHTMTDNERMRKAIADLDTQEKPDYSATARKYKLERLTLWRHHTGLCRSRKNFLFKSIQNFNNEREQVLIGYINYLTA